MDRLKEFGKKYSVQIHAYVLMTNHVHLLVTPETENGVSQMMQSLGRYYVRYVNQAYRTGTLWEGRYKSTLVDSENYFLVVSRYIELNPVRAEMVVDPADYPWSSYHSNAGNKEIALLTPHTCYKALGKTLVQQRAAYTELFKGRILTRTLDEIRNATNKAWVLGSDRFKLQVEAQTGRVSMPTPRGGDRKFQAYLDGQNQ